ncbi:hypothetical protein [Nocardia sp. NPDC050175]|uniref:hypothetical protein n=1 Tax=Nocardia sp. NPDC050175 TaxID=3364317 RepID=UPI003791EB58
MLLIALPAPPSMVRTPPAGQPVYLLPGRSPTRPRHVAGLRNQLAKHGLPVIHARNTAMMAIVTDLPPSVVCDLFGVHIHTAQLWARYAQSSWIDYLAAPDYHS